MKKLDTARPYGKICGDHEASFEQDGRYFDANGDELEPSTQQGKVSKTAPTTSNVAAEAARKFLQKLLVPNESMLRSTVAKEAEMASILWESVEAQFKALGGVASGKASKVMWNLPVQG